MTTEEFRKFKRTGLFKGHVYRIKGDDRFEITPNQACSIEELMLRQAQGLPMPNLTPIVHTAFNGYDLDNLPISARKGADVIDVMRDIKNTQSEIIADQNVHKYDIQAAINKLGMKIGGNKENKEDKN